MQPPLTGEAARILVYSALIGDAIEFEGDRAYGYNPTWTMVREGVWFNPRAPRENQYLDNSYPIAWLRNSGWRFHDGHAPTLIERLDAYADLHD